MQYSFILAVLAAVSNAAPTPQSGYNSASAVAISSAQVPSPTVHCVSAPTSATPAKVSIAASQIAAAAPSSAACATTGGACSSPDAAAQGISAAFSQYGNTALGQKAALLGLMSFESVDFQFNVNMFPGRPGQGTKSMMMFNFILPYALAQPELKDQVTKISGGNTDANSISDDKKNAIRALVLPDKYTFGSASWYLQHQCTSSFASALATEVTPAGTTSTAPSKEFTAFSSYITNCVETTMDSDRTAKWCLAYKALKSASDVLPAECN